MPNSRHLFLRSHHRPRRPPTLTRTSRSAPPPPRGRSPAREAFREMATWVQKATKAMQNPAKPMALATEESNAPPATDPTTATPKATRETLCMRSKFLGNRSASIAHMERSLSRRGSGRSPVASGDHRWESRRRALLVIFAAGRPGGGQVPTAYDQRRASHAIGCWEGRGRTGRASCACGVALELSRPRAPRARRGGVVRGHRSSWTARCGSVPAAG